MSKSKAGSKKKGLWVAGLMSGTSADGVDVAIVEIHGRKVRVLAFETFPYSASLRKSILALCNPEAARVDDICHFNHVLGEVFAEAVIRLCNKSGLPLDSIDLIGSHGQTIWHHPQGIRYEGEVIRSTLQIGEPCRIAQRTGITTVADFRPRDMAAGGEGAPLVPYADYVLFSDKKLCRTVQNIGGIANVTYLPVCENHGDCSHSCSCGHDAHPEVLAFDTGPGNMVIDGLVRRMTKGRRHYDRGGAMAAKGMVHEGLLKEMLRHPFLRRKPPKSTGREQFGQHYCEWLHGQARKRKLSPEDMIATATAFTASTIAAAYRKFLPAMPDEMILCGGGSHNATLVSMLQSQLPDVRIRTTDEFGISVDAKEAVSFAILAYATIQGIANNLPSVTGADEPVILGKIVPGV
ncbi:MAG TPA: anhydro-N-acetylmuramic acid kinase [Sedimentisphaerales bacterium]|nr:anhydro-N-acetylmuramic acid kinase [Phycisphaerae bacterium]HON91665.1 anhydro-N-acetylmuramic acid kinase [Sedimentisphaerales bacterium]HQI27890.1 anhydro-N-acetylmuramic acid kinase [Sedimentisphaerales bacterium]